MRAPERGPRKWGLREDEWTAVGVIAAVSLVWIPYIFWGR